MAVTLPTQSLIGIRDDVQRKDVASRLGRRYEIDLVKAGAAVLLFLFHFFGLLGELPETWVEWGAFRAFSLKIGDFGLHALLFLGGFGLARSLAAPKFEFVRSVQYRLSALYAPYAAVIALATALSIVFPALSKFEEGENPVFTIFQQFLLVPGLFPESPLLSVAYVLTAMVAAAVLCPLWHWPMRDAGVWKGAAYWLATTAGAALLADLAGVPLYYIAVLAGVAGYFVAKAVEAKTVGLVLPLVLFAAALGLGVYLALGLNGNWEFPLIGQFGFEMLTLLLLTAAVVASPETATPALLHPLQFFGMSSYSFYLLHGSVTKVMLLVLFPGFGYQLSAPTDLAIALVVCLGAALVASQILYRAVEAPVRVRFAEDRERVLSEEEKRLLIASLQPPGQARYSREESEYRQR
ncbi:MAG: hypothetical protein OHK0021_12360 [Bryobacter sp.]